MLLSYRAARTHLDAPRHSKYFLRRRSAGSVSPGFWPTGSPCSATARWFAANPSDPTSRWAPCPACPMLRTPRREAGNKTTTCRWHAPIPAVSCAGAHVPSPWIILGYTSSRLPQHPATPDEELPPPLATDPAWRTVRLDFHQLGTCAARRTLRPPPTPCWLVAHFPCRVI